MNLVQRLALACLASATELQSTVAGADGQEPTCTHSVTAQLLLMLLGLDSNVSCLNENSQYYAVVP
jgi:hypothetical protein